MFFDGKAARYITIALGAFLASAWGFLNTGIAVILHPTKRGLLMIRRGR